MAEETTENTAKTVIPEEPTAHDGPSDSASAGDGPFEGGIELMDDVSEADDTAYDGGQDGIHLVEDSPEQAEIARLEGVVEELQSRLRAVSAAYQKQQGEISATRDRLKRQAAVQEELRRGEVVAGLFDPVENLRRSLEAARKGASTEDTVKGLEIILKAFMNSFQKLGLEEVPGKGAAFDPNVHEALTTMPVADPALDQVVIEVFSSGYRIGSRLIAPAKVIVGAYQEPVGEA